jgi:hypothetical protein
MLVRELPHLVTGAGDAGEKAPQIKLLALELLHRRDSLGPSAACFSESITAGHFSRERRGHTRGAAFGLVVACRSQLETSRRACLWVPIDLFPWSSVPPAAGLLTFAVRQKPKADGVKR